MCAGGLAMKHEAPKARGPQTPQTQQRGTGVGPQQGQGRATDAAGGHRYAGGAAMRATQPGGQAAIATPGVGPSSELERQATELQGKHGEQLAIGAQRLGVPEEALAAVLLTEHQYLPRSTPATADKMPVRFEPYVYFVQTGRWLAATHRDQAAEYGSFDQARGQDDTAAHRALRMGVGQVSGIEAESAGFSTPQAMHEALQGGAAAQIEALLTLVQAQDGLRGALGQGDWAQTALLRAGPGYGALAYDQTLQASAAAYRSVKPGGGDDSGDDKPKKRKKS